MSSSRNSASKQKKSKEFTHEASYAPVHEPRTVTTAGSQSFSPPPLQLQATTPASTPDHHPSGPVDSGLTPVSSAGETGGAATELAPAQAEAPTKGPDDGLRGNPNASPQGGGDGLAPVPGEHGGGENVNAEDGLPAVEGAHAGNGNVNPADGLPVVGEGEEGGVQNTDPYEPETAPRFPACEADGAVNDWTTEERANLDMGDDLSTDLQSRLSEACHGEMEEYGQNLLNEEICRVIPQHGRNLERTVCDGQVDFNDVHGMIEQIGQDVPTDVQRVAAYNALSGSVVENSPGIVGSYVGQQPVVNPHDMNPDMIDPADPNTSWKHAVTPFTDGYHGWMGGVDGDATEPFIDPSSPTLTFLDQENAGDMGWLNSLPAADSIAGQTEDPGDISRAYAMVLEQEGTPEDAGFMTSIKRSAGGSLPDARSSIATIENYRDFRSEGWSGFADGFRERIIAPQEGE